LGLTGTFAFGFLSARFSLVTTGLWSILYQLLFISISMMSFFILTYNGASLSILVISVCASRIGLWVFDIAVTQLMQEFIPEGIRGAVGGTQHALNAFFQLASFCFGFVFSAVQDFPIYAFLGYVTVVVAVAIYLGGVFVKKESFVTRTERLRV
jgi:solute carrier family 40 (iron-regulated transporter), member 1